MYLSAALVMAVIVLAGCSDEPKGEPASDKDSAPSVSQSEAPAAPSDEAIKPFVEALASQDATQMRKAQKAAARGSLAAAYAEHQANNAEAVLDGGGQGGAAGEITEQGTGSKVCYSDEEGSPCYVYDNFKLSSQGQVASFTMDNRPLSGRLVVGDGSRVTSRLGDITLLSAYTTQAGDLAVAAKVKTKDAAIYIHDAAARYRAPDGRQRGQNALAGPYEIGADSLAMVVFYFPGPIKFGGSMTVELNQDDNSTDPVSLTLRIK